MEQLATLVAADAVRYAVPAGFAFTVFWMWKWDALAHRRIQQRRPTRTVFKREIAYSISTVLIFASSGYVTFLLQQRGLLEVYKDVDTYGWPYWIASVVLAIVIHDAYFYWTHRAMHHERLFRLFHRVHHLSTSPSPWAAYAFAPAEAVVEALVVPVILAILPMHPAALFVFLIYMILMNVNAHLGFELCPRWFTRSRWTRAFTTSTHHNLHHRDFHGNYGFYFTWWDRLMKTQHADYHATYDELTRRAL
jgi:sterol desaturase/sphingolipid hydroxylase (fatty acid hydroxylase superfamily)